MAILLSLLSYCFRNRQGSGLLFVLISACFLTIALPVEAQGNRPGESNPITPASRKLQFASHHALAMAINPLSGSGAFSFSDWARSSDLLSLEPQYYRYGEVVFDNELTAWRGGPHPESRIRPGRLCVFHQRRFHPDSNAFTRRPS